MNHKHKQLRASRPENSKPERSPASERTVSLLDVIERGVEILPGGHAVWKYTGRRVRVNEGEGLIQRLWFESRNGEIPPGRFLLNACLVPNCIHPDCWFVSRFARLCDVWCAASEPCSSGPLCASPARQEASCGQR